ncbi:uncharacterized protein HGUI_00092 [Hanseniaspora guilliermondii]|uniref:Uncharacterized protein n=1 Tax=Hanseniaspora guilliermondii TaxID=56406 RepID=A0A1L0AW49_9ASCO|nr:uncharacterized protein HGUI_00092 [Hanseniaspora guilliermondii]
MMNSEYYNMPFDKYNYNNQNNFLFNNNQIRSDNILSDKYPSSCENNSLFSNNDIDHQTSYDITEEFYKLHILKLQNEKMTYNKYNIHEQEQELQLPNLPNNNGYKLHEREHYDIETYEPPTYESWEEDEDLDMVIDLNKSTSISSGVFQFDDANRDFQLNNQFQNFKL